MLQTAQKLCDILKENKMTIATAESCTGGLIGAVLTSIPGVSEVYGYGVITYANEAKEKLLSVKHQTLNTKGAVDKETAIEMAQGALDLSGSDVAVSVTGIAGPGGGTDEKPVGLVYIGISKRGESPKVFKNIFSGDRNQIRESTVIRALELVMESIQ